MKVRVRYLWGTLDMFSILKNILYTLRISKKALILGLSILLTFSINVLYLSKNVPILLSSRNT